VLAGDELLLSNGPGVVVHILGQYAMLLVTCDVRICYYGQGVI
jgi:hypothetical protein